MNPKIEITKKVLELLNPNYSEKEYKKSLTTWWVNFRQKKQGGLKLTEYGLKAFQLAGVRQYFVRFDTPQIFETNQSLIQLDNFMDCPFYLTKKGIYVFGEKTAVQLVLLSGNVHQFTKTKAIRQIDRHF